MKVITLSQFEKDLDRILDDVIDDREHYHIKTPMVTNITGQGLAWEDKAVMILPVEDYEILKEGYDMWQANYKEEITQLV